MAKGQHGSLVSIHGGSTGKTCILVASGTCPEHLAADISHVVGREDGFRCSNIRPTVHVYWNDNRVIVSGEGGDVEVLASAAIAELSKLPAEPPELVL